MLTERKQLTTTLAGGWGRQQSHTGLRGGGERGSPAAHWAGDKVGESPYSTCWFLAPCGNFVSPAPSWLQILSYSLVTLSKLQPLSPPLKPSTICSSSFISFLPSPFPPPPPSSAQAQFPLPGSIPGSSPLIRWPPGPLLSLLR